jgi:hypothetical protein
MPHPKKREKSKKEAKKNDFEGGQATPNTK